MNDNDNETEQQRRKNAKGCPAITLWEGISVCFHCLCQCEVVSYSMQSNRAMDGVNNVNVIDGT